MKSLCCVGLIAALPVAALIQVYTYRRLTGGQVVEAGSSSPDTRPARPPGSTRDSSTPSLGRSSCKVTETGQSTGWPDKRMTAARNAATIGARCGRLSLVMGSAVMSIKVALEHRTSYTFDRLVQVYPHVVRLRPAPHSRTTIEAYSLRIDPAEHFINWQQDALGNFLARLVFPNPTRQLTITVGLIADLKVINPFDFFIEDWAETWPLQRPG